MFEILEFTEARLASVTNRIEKHGDEDVPAVSLTVEFTAENTLRRIARGVMRYVVNAAQPYIVRIGHTGHGDAGKVCSVHEPVSTITSKAEHLLAVPTLVQTGYGERKGQAPRSLDLHAPLGTVVGGGQKHALCAAFLAKHYGGNETPGTALDKPMDTITTQDHHALVASSMVKLRGTSTASSTGEPLHTISASGTHHAEVRALLIKFYGTEQDPRIDEPLHTITTKDRFGLVVVKGEVYAIADIGMRMLEPRELYRAQGFPDSYVIDRRADGTPLPKHAQVRMVGNSVSPVAALSLVAANYSDAQTMARAA